MKKTVSKDTYKKESQLSPKSAIEEIIASITKTDNGGKLEEKLQRIEALRKKKYKEIISDLSFAKTQEEITGLIDNLNQVAKFNIDLGNQLKEKLGAYEVSYLRYYNDAAVCSRYIITITTDTRKDIFNNNQKILPFVKESFNNLSVVQEKIASALGIAVGTKVQPIKNLKDMEETSGLKTVLSPLRELVSNQIAENKPVSEIFKDIIPGMKKYAECLHTEAEKVLGKAPCDYTVIGLGSMALGQMTPYSDLEFAILIDYPKGELANQRKVKLKAEDGEELLVKNYFKVLSHYVNFKVICLGETTIPGSHYGVNLDNFGKPAVNLDLGGKVPLGRVNKKEEKGQVEYKSYELIGRVEDFVKYVQNENYFAENIDKNLPYVLEKSCFICGKEELFKEYEGKVKDFLNSPSYKDPKITNGEQRAVKALLEGCVEPDYSTGQKTFKQLQKGNIEEFAFNALGSQGRIYNIKKEIYRLPDRLIYNLGLIYGVESENGWEVIDKLHSKGILSEKGTNNLKDALGFATGLRLKAYSYYGYQKDVMGYDAKYENLTLEQQSALAEQEAIKMFRLAKEELQAGGSLFKYYYTTIPLTEKLKELSEKLKKQSLTHEEKIKFFVQENFYQDNAGVKAQVNLRLLKMQETLKYQLEELEELKAKFNNENHYDVATSYNNVGLTYEALGEAKTALEYQKEALKLVKELFDDLKHPDVATIYNNMGRNYGALGEANTALKYQEEALEIRKELFGCNHEHVAQSYNDLGSTYQHLRKHEKALEYQEEALKIVKELFGSNHQHVATSYHNIGSAYSGLGKYSIALYYQKKGLKILEELFVSNHPEIAASYNNLSIICCKSGNYSKTLEYQAKVLKILEELFGLNHPNVATSYHTMGGAYSGLGNYSKALWYQEKALKMREELFDPSHHVALSYDTCVIIYKHLGYEYKAQEFFKLKALSGSKEPHSFICKRGEVSEKLIQVMVEAVKDLNEIADWPDIKRIKKLIKKYKHTEEKELVKMLCFEAVCLGLYFGELKQVLTKLNVLKEFIKEHKTLISKIAKEHPEFFVKKDAVKFCMKVLGAEPEELKALLVEPKVVILQADDKGKEEMNFTQIKEEKLPPTAELFAPKLLARSCTNLAEIPDKAKGNIRVVSYNITADFFDEKDKTQDKHHKWEYRAPLFKKLLGMILPDIMCLQELSPNQAIELQSYLKDYSCVFLSQTPSEIETGAVVFDEEIKQWQGKRAGTPLVGTFIIKSWKFAETGRFWLNEQPDEVPQNTDRGKTDKGFGNMNTYRAVLWAKIIEHDSQKCLFIFNAHYPLDGNNKTRLECAKLEMAKITLIAKGEKWISAGDRNLIPSKDDNEVYNLETLYLELVKGGKDLRDCQNHYGISTTWLGFSYDEHKNEIDLEKGDFKDNSVLDLMVSNLTAVISFHHHGAINLKTCELISLAGQLTPEHNEGRYFVSDHALIGGDFTL